MNFEPAKFLINKKFHNYMQRIKTKYCNQLIYPKKLNILKSCLNS